MTIEPSPANPFPLTRAEGALRRMLPGARSGLGLGVLLAIAVGCGDDARVIGEVLAPATPTTGPLYAIMYEVYDDVGSTSYLSVLDTLDIEAVDTAAAREYGGGRAFIQSYNGWLFVAAADAPTVTRYELSEDGQLIGDKEMSFANYGLRTSQFDDWNVTFINPEKAYLMDFTEGRTIIWNPTTMEVTGDIPPPAALYREGLSLEGSPAALRGNRLLRTFNWVNYDTAEYSTDFVLGVYDVETDQLIDLTTETRCPTPGNLLHQDEAGNVYFSNWIWPVAGTIMRGAPESCVLRIDAGEERFNPSWTLDYPQIADGRRGAMFTYLQNGQGLISAFYDERTSFDETSDPWSYVGSTNWRIWSVDIDDRTGAPLAGLDFNGGAFTPVQFDDRLFLLVPGGEAESYATQLYEVVDGVAQPFVKLPGWSYQFVKLR